jgi:hypothetical protein
MNCGLSAYLLLCLVLTDPGAAQAHKPARLRGEVVDADTGQPLACRLYLQAEKGAWYFPKSASPAGTAIPYQRKIANHPNSVEMHTSLSAHPFLIDLPPGKYTFTIERGKEYFPLSQQIKMEGEPVQTTFRLRRWINMSRRSWYSGDTHVHRPIDELPNLLKAEDLNVAFPLTSWVTEAFASPRTAAKSTRTPLAPTVVAVDATHVYYPVNTEYEIFTVGRQAHMLGAVFVLNHQRSLEEGIPPVRPVARQARRQGGLLELDKHNWPWSMAIVPLMDVDLFELSNNHCWRTDFAFGGWAEREAPYMHVERNAAGWTEWGWIDFGFQTYYALLNCGFRLRPTAGTATGVHPVPLGFGRVYVHLPDGFSYASWLRGLNQGNSFVTTGPMVFVEVNGQAAGHVFKQTKSTQTYRITGSAVSQIPLDRIEILVNGIVVEKLKPANRPTEHNAFESTVDARSDRGIVVDRGTLLRGAAGPARSLRAHRAVAYRGGWQAASPAPRGD